MPNFIMRADGIGYSIRRARRNVGSIRRAEGSQDWVARIGQHVFQSYSAEQAFREVAALALGFANAAALRAHNRTIRQRNTAARARQRATIRGFMDDVGLRPRAVTTPGPVDDEPFGG